jgi:hypothetical protein
MSFSVFIGYMMIIEVDVVTDTKRRTSGLNHVFLGQVLRILKQIHIKLLRAGDF